MSDTSRPPGNHARGLADFLPVVLGLPKCCMLASGTGAGILHRRLLFGGLSTTQATQGIHLPSWPAKSSSARSVSLVRLAATRTRYARRPAPTALPKGSAADEVVGKKGTTWIAATPVVSYTQTSTPRHCPRGSPRSGCGTWHCCSHRIDPPYGTAFCAPAPPRACGYGAHPRPRGAPHVDVQPAVARTLASPSWMSRR